MDRNVAAALVLAGVGVLGVAGITAAVDGSEGTTAVAAQSPAAVQEHIHDTGQGNGNGIGQGQGQGHGQGQGANGSGAHGQGTEHESHAAAIPDAVPNATITDAVAKELAFMVEEEKLARDVYALAVTAYPDARVFANINRAESTHMTEVQMLLERYGLTDPTDGKGVGKFENDSLQGLYDDLAARVTQSREEAVQVGVDVEVIDIADLKEAMGLDAPADVTAVLGNLLAGSERHLAAFQRNGGTVATQS